MLFRARALIQAHFKSWFRNSITPICPVRERTDKSWHHGNKACNTVRDTVLDIGIQQNDCREKISCKTKIPCWSPKSCKKKITWRNIELTASLIRKKTTKIWAPTNVTASFGSGYLIIVPAQSKFRACSEKSAAKMFKSIVDTLKGFSLGLDYIYTLYTNAYHLVTCIASF